MSILTSRSSEFKKSENSKQANKGKHTYSICKARRRYIGEEKQLKKSVTWLLYEDSTLMLEVCKFLEIKGTDSSNTSATYAYALATYFRYVDMIGKSYLSVNKKDFINYVTYLLLQQPDGTLGIGDKENVRKLSTVRQNVSIIGTFYDWLEATNDDEFVSPIPISNKSKKNKSKNNYSFLYGQFYEAEDETRKKILPKLKQKANLIHKKWYTETEIEILANGFKNRRDKVIFLISVRLGCRINEILSIGFEDYNTIEQTLFIRESKTNQRYLYVDRELCDEIDAYVFTERRDVESDIGLLDYLFVNLRKGDSYGERVSPRNYLKILKGYSKKVGFNPKEIITHSGRATKAQELIEQQVIEEDQSINDTYIDQVMGWNNPNSKNRYLKQTNLKMQKHVSNKIRERKRKSKEE